MTLRQDETDVNFLDIKPADLEHAAEVLRRAMTHYDLSARAYDRILKVARTVADLDGSPAIERRHVVEAVGYRRLDQAGWGE